MKYFQSIGSIKDHYDNIFRLGFDDDKYGKYTLDNWNIDATEKDLILEERELLRYLLGCQLTLVHVSNVKKPSLEAVNRCFNRHLYFLEKFDDINAYNVNKHPSKNIQKEYKACRHYLFKFSLPAWYDKLPDEILTFENKYKDFNNKNFEV
jgi:hypothetical protein